MLAFPEVDRIADPPTRRAVQLLFGEVAKLEGRVHTLEAAVGIGSTDQTTLTSRLRRLEDTVARL